VTRNHAEQFLVGFSSFKNFTHFFAGNFAWRIEGSSNESRPGIYQQIGWDFA
jgi:hypothetical protein